MIAPRAPASEENVEGTERCARPHARERGAVERLRRRLEVDGSDMPVAKHAQSRSAQIAAENDVGSAVAEQPAFLVSRIHRVDTQLLSTRSTMRQCLGITAPPSTTTTTRRWHAGGRLPRDWDSPAEASRRLLLWDCSWSRPRLRERAELRARWKPSAPKSWSVEGHRPANRPADEADDVEAACRRAGVDWTAPRAGSRHRRVSPTGGPRTVSIGKDDTHGHRRHGRRHSRAHTRSQF